VLAATFELPGVKRPSRASTEKALGGLNRLLQDVKERPSWPMLLERAYSSKVTERRVFLADDIHQPPQGSFSASAAESQYF